MSDWTRVRKGNECPICGRDHFCAFHAEGWVRCKKRGPGDAPETPGWTYIMPLRTGAGQDGRPAAKDGPSWKWTPPGFVPLEAPQRSDGGEDEKAKEERRIRQAQRIWSRANDPDKDCGPNHRRLRQYLEARGIPVELLPGGLVPACLRYTPACDDRWDGKKWLKAPAIVAQVVQADGKSYGIHRTFLDADEPKKRPGGHGEARKKLGKCSGGAVRLSDNSRSGVLLVGEGIETVGAALAACGSRVAAWAALDAVAMENLVLPDAMIAYGVGGTIHTVIIVADLDASGTGQAAAYTLAGKIRARAPWLTVEVALPTETLYPELVATTGKEPVPRESKSVDWNDVFVHYGAEQTARGILGRIDLERNRRRAFEWRPGSASPLSAAFDGSAPSPPPADEFPAAIEASPLARARRYLLEQESPPDGQRAGRGFYLRRWNGQWWEYDLTKWTLLPAEHLRGRVWHWLEGFHTRDRRGGLQPLNPTKGDIDEIVAALTTDTAVSRDTMPRWLPPSFAADGQPRWGLAAPGRRYEDELPQATDIVAFDNVLLDAGKWGKGELDLIRHHPLWFSGAVLPFPLPYQELAEAVNAGREEELLAKLCPTWLAFLQQVASSPAWIHCLQEFFGYSLVLSTKLEKILLIQGPTRSGKGTIERAWEAVLGIENIVYTSFDQLTTRFHLTAFVGKHLAVMSDAHVGRWTDTTAAVERLKSISGGDAQLIERKNVSEMPMLRLPTRFIVYCNETPSLADSSNAFAGRLIVLPMTKSFLGREDLSLKDRIVAEAPGIMVWALFGLRRLWQRVEAGDGFTIPNESKRAVEELARDSAPAHSFVEDCLALDPGSVERVAVVYQAWRKWCEANGRHAGAIETFSRKLHAAYPQIQTKQRVVTEDLARAKVRCYIGLKLTAPPPGYERPPLSGQTADGLNDDDDDEVDTTQAGSGLPF